MRLDDKVVGPAMVVILAALVVTFDRAGILALCGGIVLFSLLLPYRRWGRVGLAALALSIPIYAVTTSPSTLQGASTSTLISQGVLRTSTISERTHLAAIALAVVPTGGSDLAFGRGFDSLLGPPGSVPAALAANPGLLNSGGPNDDYLRSLLEQGIAGLILTILWLGGSIVVGVRSCIRLPPASDRRVLTAALTASVFGYSLAIVGHDALHNVVMLSMAALVTGFLVTVCSLARPAA